MKLDIHSKKTYINIPIFFFFFLKIEKNKNTKMEKSLLHNKVFIFLRRTLSEQGFTVVATMLLFHCAPVDVVSRNVYKSRRKKKILNSKALSKSGTP